MSVSCTSSVSVISRTSRVGSKFRMSQCLSYIVDQFRILQLARREIDADPHANAMSVQPMTRLQAGPLKHCATERQDEASLFGERNELGRWDHAALLVVPPNERFDSSEPL